MNAALSTGQKAVNDFISKFGMEVCVDQANGVKAYRAGNEATHQIVKGNVAIEGDDSYDAKAILSA